MNEGLSLDHVCCVCVRGLSHGGTGQVAAAQRLAGTLDPS
jgi:hypothetical protein